jgi:hypothetical protein
MICDMEPKSLFLVVYCHKFNSTLGFLLRMTTPPKNDQRIRTE